MKLCLTIILLFAGEIFCQSQHKRTVNFFTKFSWSRTLQNSNGASVHVQEAAYVNNTHRVVIMDALDSNLKSAGISTSMSLHDFANNVAAFKLVDNKYCFLTTPRQTFETTKWILNKRQNDYTNKGRDVPQYGSKMVLKADVDAPPVTTQSKVVTAFCKGRTLVMTESCTDKSPRNNCQMWKSYGYCLPTSQYASFMGTNCTQSCGNCGKLQHQVWGIIGPVDIHYNGKGSPDKTGKETYNWKRKLPGKSAWVQVDVPQSATVDPAAKTLLLNASGQLLTSTQYQQSESFYDFAKNAVALKPRGSTYCFLTTPRPSYTFERTKSILNIRQQTFTNNGKTVPQFESTMVLEVDVSPNRLPPKNWSEALTSFCKGRAVIQTTVKPVHWRSPTPPDHKLWGVIGPINIHFKSR